MQPSTNLQNSDIYAYNIDVFDCDSHLAKKLTVCLNELSLVPSLSWMNYWLIEPRAYTMLSPTTLA